MKIINRFLFSTMLLGAFTLSSQAATVLLTFDGLADQTPIGNYYNGGAGGNYGISFSSNALAINEFNNNEGMLPSAPNGLFFLSGAGAILNDSTGFTSGFSFYYSAPFYAGVINVYSGLNGTGSLLATLNLPVTTNGVSLTGCLSHNFCPYVPIGVSFTGTAESVDFGGTENQIVFDNVTIGASVPVTTTTSPEPTSWLLAGSGIALVLGSMLRRKRAA